MQYLILCSLFLNNPFDGNVLDNHSDSLSKLRISDYIISSSVQFQETLTPQKHKLNIKCKNAGWIPPMSDIPCQLACKAQGTTFLGCTDDGGSWCCGDK